MIPYGKQSIDQSDIDAVVETLKSPFLTQGPKVKEFEEKLAAYSGAKYAVAVSNGTAALHVAYLAAGIKAGDEVITSPNTFVATSNMLLVIGAKPVFCDLRPDTCNIDETKIEKLITKKTKAIVPVHFAGNPCDMDKIKSIAKKHKLLVIEDACHALGASFKDKKIGSIGDMSVFSFHPVKSITTGEGGAILTDNKKFYEKMLTLRSHGIHKDKKGLVVMTHMGWNYRITDIQAALGVSQLKKLDGFIDARRQVVKWYEEAFKGAGGIILPEETAGSKSAWHVYVIRVKNKKDRFPLANFLKEKGIGINFHYPAVYGQPYYRKNGYAKTKLKEADLYNITAITLPLFPNLSRQEVKLIVRSINEYFIKN